MLRDSVLSSTFGTISDDAALQALHEKSLVDRLTNLLFDVPKQPSDEVPYADDELAQLRIEVLDLFRAMCLSDHGGLLLGRHRHAVGRLVRFVDVQINRLYSLRPVQHTKPLTDEPTAHFLVVRGINKAVRTLYHLLRTYDSIISISEKLNAIHGGYHIFLISMTRLAFSEQLVLEHGVEDEVAEAAHTILDNVLSPEEGANIREAVETPKSTRARDTSFAPEPLDDDTAMDESTVL